jgi:hypothetical protein
VKPPDQILEMALSVASPADLDSLWAVLDDYAPHRRPVGDRWGNRGLFTAAGGMFDLKLVELVTNMHDAVVHAAAVERLGSKWLSEEAWSTLYDTPAAAVADLLADQPRAALAALATVELRAAGEDHRRDRTVVFRDLGIGMRPEDIPGALYRVGSSKKDGVLWQLGAFGRGGLTVLPNCYGWVVVSRPRIAAQDAADSAPDDIVISVVRWERVGNRQTETALYQVTSTWNSDGDRAAPPAFPSSMCGTFVPGTHLAAVGFHAEGIWVSRLGDERSIDTLLDTRLFEPSLPLSLTTPVFGDRADRVTILRGLGRRLSDNPRTDRLEGREELPFLFGGTTYRLLIRFYLFAAGEKGQRRRFVARDHALLLNSNGQVHAHWTPAEFRQKTRLPKLADRILVVVDTDALPLSLRTALFTADRTELLRNAEAVRLEEEIVGFLDDWDELWEANSAMVRDAIRRSNVERSTVAVAGRIARALSLRAATPPARERSAKRARPPLPREVHDDPTLLSAPAEVTAMRGRTRGIYVSLDARDQFIPRRAQCRVATTHLDIDVNSDATVGELRNGRLRISLAVPPDAELCTSELTISVGQWVDASGSLRDPLVTSLRLIVTDEPDPAPARVPPAKSGDAGTGQAAVALLWTTHEAEPGWTAMTVGGIDVVDADVLADAHDDYRPLRGRHFEVPVIKLNEEFAPLKAYVSVRARAVGDEGVARAKDRYALGVGVEMMLLEADVNRKRKAGEQVPDDFVERVHSNCARAVLAVLPDFDRLTSEAGLDDI